MEKKKISRPRPDPSGFLAFPLSFLLAFLLAQRCGDAPAGETRSPAEFLLGAERPGSRRGSSSSFPPRQMRRIK